MSARDDILRRLRAALGRPAAPADAVRVAHPAVAEADGPPPALAARFVAELERHRGTAEVMPGAAAAAAAVVARLQAWAAEDAPAAGAAGEPPALSSPIDVLAWSLEELGVPQLETLLAANGFRLVTPGNVSPGPGRVRAAACRYGVTGVEAAFAATGSLLLDTAAGRPRVASLLPLRHIALVPFSRLHASMERWLAALRLAGAAAAYVRDRAALVLVHGPSKTSDIEMHLTLGVHGPRSVHVVLFDDAAPAAG